MTAIERLRDRLEATCHPRDEVFEWLNELEVQLSILEYDLRDAQNALGWLGEDDTDYDFNPWDGEDIYGEGIGDSYD